MGNIQSAVMCIPSEMKYNNKNKKVYCKSLSKQSLYCSQKQRIDNQKIFSTYQFHNQKQKIQQKNQQEQQNLQLNLNKKVVLQIIGNNFMIPIKLKPQGNLIDSKFLNSLPVYIEGSQKIVMRQKQKGDKRKAITINEYPYSSIGLLYVQFQSACYGTAFLVSHNVALTAAHNLYSRNLQTYTNIAILTLGMTTSKPISYEVAYAFIPKQYRQLESDKKAKVYDYAVLILNNTESLGQTFGFMSVQSLPKDISIQKTQVHIYGFPLDKNIEKNKEQKKQNIQQIRTMFGCKDFLKEAKFQYLKQKLNCLLFHQVDTEVGQSGSPILLENKNKFSVIGIHTGFIQNINHGIKISQQLLKRMNEWVDNFEKESEQRVQLCNRSIINTKQMIKMIKQEWKKDSLDKVNIQPISNQQISQDLKQQINKKNQEAMKQYNNKNIKQQLWINLFKKSLTSQHLSHLLKQTIINSKILQFLQLDSNQIQSQGIKQLCRFYFPQLIMLSINNNKIDSYGMKYLCDNAMTKFPSLQKLFIYGNRISKSKIKQQNLNMLITSKNFKHSKIANFKKLKRLSLSFNFLNDDDIQELFQEEEKQDIQNNQSFSERIEALFLSGTKMSQKTTKLISKKQWKSLKQLYLQCCCLDKENIQPLTLNEKAFPSLQQLSLSNIKPTYNYSLDQLQKYKNIICSISIRKLSSNKKLFKSLLELNICGNSYFSNYSLKELMQGADAFPSLQRLKMDIGLNNIGIGYMIDQKYHNQNYKLNAFKSIKSIYISKSYYQKDKQQMRKKLKQRFPNAYICIYY